MKNKEQKAGRTKPKEAPAHMARGRHKKAKGIGRRVLLFFTTLILCLALFCTGGYFLLRSQFLDTGADASSAPVNTSSRIDAPAPFNCLIVQTAEPEAMPRFWLVRFVADPGSVTVTALPAETMIESAGRQDRLYGFLKYGGVSTAGQAVADLLDISVDRTLQLTTGQMESVVDQFGGVVYTIPHRLEEYSASGDLLVALSAGRQNLTGAYVRQLLDYSLWEDGRARQISVQQEIVAALINQFLTPYSLGQAETRFLYLVNHSETNLSRADFDAWLPWFQNMAGSSPASVKRAEGSFSQVEGAAVFIMDEEQRHMLGQAFSAV